MWDVVLGIAYGGLVALGYWASRESKKNRPSPSSSHDALVRELASAGEQLGLHSNGTAVSGRLSDPPVHVELNARLFSLGQAAWRFDYHVSARIEPQLGLGLSITSVEEQNFMERTAAPVEDVISSKFDGGFHVELRDPSRAQSLISGRPEELLLAALARKQFATVTDGSVTLHTEDRLDVGELVEFIRSAALIAHALERANAGLPELSPAEQAWMRIAKQLDADYDAATRCIDLETEHGIVRISTPLQHGPIAVELRFNHPLPVDLHLADVGALSRWDRVTGQDIRVGDPVFDTALIVRASNDAVARSVLDAPARDRVKALLRVVHRLELDPESVRVEISGRSDEPDSLSEVVARMDGVAEALMPKRRTSAYRG